MNKSYTLLRNNNNSGPYSLTDLPELALTAHDLIWVEGESAGWRYPSEIEELKAFVKNSQTDNASSPFNKNPDKQVPAPTITKVNPRKIFVSLPIGLKNQTPVVQPTLEEKAEALRKKVLDIAEQKSEGLEVKHSRSIEEIKEEYSDWIHQQKTKRRNRFQLATPVFYSFLFVAVTGISFIVLQWNPKKETYHPAITLTNPTHPEVIKPTSTNNMATSHGPDETKQVNAIATNKTLQKNKKPNYEVTYAKQTSSPQPVVDKLPAVIQAKEEKLQNKVNDIALSDLMETTSFYTRNKDGIGLSITLHNKSNQAIR
ncbi:MAG: hypothetical protein M3Y85_04585, partial [Bacteroidota bacterium]|nr:hypothetical protein [Bacteroidota bacterium]